MREGGGVRKEGRTGGGGRITMTLCQWLVSSWKMFGWARPCHPVIVAFVSPTTGRQHPQQAGACATFSLVPLVPPCRREGTGKDGRSPQAVCAPLLFGLFGLELRLGEGRFQISWDPIFFFVCLTPSPWSLVSPSIPVSQPFVLSPLSFFSSWDVGPAQHHNATAAPFCAF